MGDSPDRRGTFAKLPLACAVLVASSASALAQGRTVEEIVVTAQKQEENLREVPISISVVDADFIARQGIADFADLSAHVPNFQITDHPFGIEPRIRGFSTDPTNLGFEQAVGIVIDGVAYGRGDFFQAGLFDLDRVEVLRGPQGYLFGKNATVGLLNVTTKSPTDALEGFVSGQAGELGRRRLEAAAGGPAVPDRLNVRVAGLFDDRDGHYSNTTARRHDIRGELFERERRAFRVKAELPDLLGTRIGLGYERAAFDTLGVSSEITLMPESVKAFMRRFDADTDFDPDNYVASERFPGEHLRDTHVVVASASRDLAGWGLDLLFGFSRLDSETELASATPAPLIHVVTNDLVEEQTTVELRGTSPILDGLLGLGELFGVGLGTSDFTLGFSFQRRVMDPVDFSVDIHAANVAQLIAINNVPALGGLLALLTPFDGLGEDYVETHHLLFTQTAESFAGFGQMNWHFADHWTLLYGMRVNHDPKSATWDARNTGPGGTPSILIAAVQGPNYSLGDDLDETHFAPRVGLRFDWTDDVDFYATWSESFRSSGFNTANASTGDDTRIYDPEEVTSWEVGAKTRLLGGAATWNVGLFHMTLENFQFFTFRPGSLLPLTFVENAGELRARGVESDLVYLPTDWLTVHAGLGFNDSEFIEFDTGPCTLDRMNADGDADDRCDLAGGPLINAPKWEITFTPMIDYPLPRVPGLGEISLLADLLFTSSVTVEYEDTKFMNQTLDTRTRQGSFFRVRADVGLADPEQGWSFAVIGENLTDEPVANAIGEIQQCAGCFSQILQPPRNVFGQFRWAF